MNKKYKRGLIIIIILVFLAVAARYLVRTNIPVLEPKGIIGQKELHLIVFALLLSLIVVIPVFTLLFVFAWRYRESNRSAKYSPDLTGSRVAEALWWLIPSVLILILSVVAWNSSHQLDPFRPIASTNKTMTIQVIALDWKWLFIYPQQKIASVNFVQMPVNTPVDFQITSDTVMNSFWIPQLGGQIYAMPGMQTQLYLMANQTGSFSGSSANISGSGFAGMTFVAKATSEAGFNSWARQAADSTQELNTSTYSKLAEPSTNSPVAYYAAPESNLFDNQILKYMMPMPQPSGATGTSTSQNNVVPSMNMPYMEMQ